MSPAQIECVLVLCIRCSGSAVNCSPAALSCITTCFPTDLANTSTSLDLQTLRLAALSSASARPASGYSCHRGTPSRPPSTHRRNAQSTCGATQRLRASGAQQSYHAFECQGTYVFTEVDRGVHDKAVEDKDALALGVLHILKTPLDPSLGRSKVPVAGIIFRRAVARARSVAPATLPSVLVQHVRVRLVNILGARALQPPREAEPLEEENRPLGRVPVVRRGPGAVVVREGVLSAGEYRCALAFTTGSHAARMHGVSVSCRKANREGRTKLWLPSPQVRSARICVIFAEQLNLAQGESDGPDWI